MPQLNDEQYRAIVKFADSLIECFEKKKRDFSDEIGRIMLDYAINIINLHKDLAEIDFKSYANERERNNLTK